MKTCIRQIFCLILASALLAGQNVMAAKIYQWTDAEGTVHFSDTPPKGNVSSEIQEMERITYAQTDNSDDEYSIMNQLERMSEWRKQAEDERMARKQLQLEEKRVAQERHASRYYNLPASSYSYNRPVYYYYPYSGYFNAGVDFRHKHHRKQFPVVQKSKPIGYTGHATGNRPGFSMGGAGF